MALERDGARGPATGVATMQPLRWLVAAFLVVTMLLVGLWTVQRTTWYLAIDQFGYLTFAEDLSHGAARHEWKLLPALQPLLPADTEIDVYAQTYIRRGDALFCRYSPGFPLILAAVRRAFGPAAEHYVNPPAVVLLLACMYFVARRVLASAWLGLGAALLVALLPNYILLWSTSPLRDVPAHLIALSGLLLLLPGGKWLRPGWRELAAGLLLGYAVTTRNDAVLYLLAAAGVALQVRTLLPRRLVLGAVGFAIGLAPLLAYNYVATGNALRPTQAMELNSVLSRAPDGSTPWWARVLPHPAVALAADEALAPRPPTGANEPTPSATPFRVQGGGLRLSNLGKTLPANVLTLRESLGDLVLALSFVGAIAAVGRPVLFFLAVPYSIVAFLFFSLWTLPGPRYLTGVLLLLPLLALEGARSVAALPAALGARAGRGAAIGSLVVVAIALAAFALRAPFAAPSALPWVTLTLVAATLIGAGAGLVVEPWRRDLVIAMVIGLGLSGILIWRSTSTMGTRASFQRSQVERARSTVAQAIDPPAVVLTTTRIGRPAENLNYYTPVQAIYLEEMARWQTQPRYTIARLIKSGFAVYLLLPPDNAKDWLANTNISTWYTSEIERTIAPDEAVDFFVASPYHRGIPLVLVRLGLKPPGR